MSNFVKNKITYVLSIALLLPLSMSLSVNAASFNTTENTGIGGNPFELGNDFSGLDVEQDRQKQALEKVKRNYLSVMDLVKKKNYQEASSKVSALIEQAPNQSIYYNLQALLQLMDKDQPAAEQSFTRAVELNTRNSQALLGLAKLALDSQQWDKAEEYANKVLAVNPYEAKGYVCVKGFEAQRYENSR